MYSPHFIGHDAALEISSLTRHALVHEPDALALMRPQNISQQRIDHDVDLNLARIGLELVVLRQFLRREQHQRIARKRIV